MADRRRRAARRCGIDARASGSREGPARRAARRRRRAAPARSPAGVGWRPRPAPPCAPRRSRRGASTRSRPSRVDRSPHWSGFVVRLACTSETTSHASAASTTTTNSQNRTGGLSGRMKPVSSRSPTSTRNGSGSQACRGFERGAGMGFRLSSDRRTPGLSGGTGGGPPPRRAPTRRRRRGRARAASARPRRCSRARLRGRRRPRTRRRSQGCSGPRRRARACG